MKCEWVQQNVLLYVYDELPDDARHELEQHVVRCKDCAAELESVRKFRAGFAQFPMQEPNPSFLAASRMPLQEGMDSVDLLTQQPNNQHVREALLYALRYDSNTGVRLKALDSLGPFVKDDVQVRDAVLESLMSDANPGVRIEALRLLVPVRADGSVRIVLQRLAAKDENRYIRSQARTLVAQLPEMN